MLRQHEEVAVVIAVCPKMFGLAHGPGHATCTPLQQPTDTHMAKPAKDAGRLKKDELRELMREAAYQDP